MSSGSDGNTRVSAVPAGLTGIAGGLFAGLTGVGGGAVMIPLLTGTMGMGQRLAHGTSLAILLFIGMAGFGVYALLEDITWHLIPALAAGSVVGGAVGARALQRLSERRLRQAFGIYLVVIALRMLLG